MRTQLAVLAIFDTTDLNFELITVKKARKSTGERDLPFVEIRTYRR